MRKGKGLATTLTAAVLAAELVGCKTQSASAPIQPLQPTQSMAAPDNASPATQQTTVAPATAQSASPNSVPRESDSVASVAGISISREEVEQPLTQAFGFNMLMMIIQRDMAREACRQAGITVSQADIDKEWSVTLDQLAKDNPDADQQKLLDQFLAQPKAPGQTSTRTEWGIIMESNACLRKLAEPKARAVITDEALHQAFDERYAAQVRVRHIAVSSLREAMQLREALDNGSDFAELARKYSRVDTAKLGGELPPFSINSSRYPMVFKQTAFALKINQVSDPVQAEGSYHLIKLEERIANKVVKFDDVKDSLREDLQESVTVEAIKAIRGRLAQEALSQMKITDPTLKAEFEKRLALRDGAIKSKEKIREEMDKERAAQATTVPTSQPTTAPATTKPAVPPVAVPPVAPATKPAPSIVAPAAVPPQATKPVPATLPAPLPAMAPMMPHTAPAAPAPMPTTAAATKPVVVNSPAAHAKPAPTTVPATKP